MMNKFKILSMMVSVFAGFVFLIKVSENVVSAGAGAVDYDSSIEIKNNVNVKNEENGGVSQEVIDRYRNYLLEYFELVHGRKIDFNKKDEAEKLYEGVKKFEQENGNVKAENFQTIFVNYIKNNSNYGLNVETVSRSKFEENLKNSAKFLRLYHNKCLYDDGSVAAFKAGGNVTNLRKIQKKAMGDYDDDCLRATYCKEFADRSMLWEGPWKLWVCGEFAVNLENAKILDKDHLEELIAIAKYNHPVDFGFVKETEANFNEAAIRKRYANFADKKEGRRWFLESYFSIPCSLFCSRNIFIDNVYRKNIGESYFDILFERVDAKKAREISEKIKPYQHQIDEFDKANGLITEKDEDFSIKNRTYYVNKTVAMLRNENFLTKLLGYDVWFSKYNLNKGESEASEWGIAPNPRNGEYHIVDYGCVSMICSDERTKERDQEGNIIAENMGQVGSNN